MTRSGRPRGRRRSGWKQRPGRGLVAEVKAVLAARDFAAPPSQYVDPVALASLIVAVAGLAWTVIPT